MLIKDKPRVIAGLIAMALGIQEPDEFQSILNFLNLYADAVIEHMRDCHSAREETAPEPAAKVPALVTVASPVEPKQETEPDGDTGNNDNSDKKNISVFSRQGGKEKQAIYARLRAYRDKHGLGSFETLSKAANGDLSADDIREMLDAAPYPITKWRVLAAALDTVVE